MTRSARQLVGEHSGETYRVGQKLTLRLAEANPVSGSLAVRVAEGSYGVGSQKSLGPHAAGSAARPPANIRHQAKRR